MCVVYHVISKGYFDNIGLHLSLGPFAWDTRFGIFGLGSLFLDLLYGIFGLGSLFLDL